MSKLLIVFFVFLTLPVFAEYTEDVSGACDAFPIKLHAMFVPIQYTCSTGYFLPANTPGCAVCPNGASCSGGTFYFDSERAQGIKFGSIASNMSDMCSVEFPEKLHALFVPNTINLNYDDGNGNTTAMTCDYGGTINIPETAPTRPGYVFTGWVVRQNEQSNE